MNLPALFSLTAEAASERYGDLVETWRGIYQSTLYSEGSEKPRAVNRVVQQAMEVARSYLARERGELYSGFYEVVLEARLATLGDLNSNARQELDHEMQTRLDETVEYVLHEITIQVERDIAMLGHALRSTVLNVQLAAQSRGLHYRSALIEYRIGNASELHFFFHDRRNQKWPSRKFVRSVVRHNLIAAYNETVLMTMATHGVGMAEVVHLDAKADVQGIEIALSSGSSLPTYAEIRNEIFHPNSDAWLRPKLPLAA